MNVITRLNDTTATLAITGRFDFNARHAFKQATDAALAGAARAILLDLRAAEYIDSAALGMLLLLRDHAQKAGKAVSLAARQGTVADILKVARFDSIFGLQVD